jgi:putative membrane protein
MRPFSALKNFLRGLLMGAADVVPGVSGGTMALIVGVYERLLQAISDGVAALLKLGRLDAQGGWKGLRAVDWALVVPLAAGILTALLVGARFIPGLLETYPEASRGLFFGLIAGSLVIPWARISTPAPRHVLLASIAAVVAFGLVGLPPRTLADPALWYVLLCASVAICAMILPGVSGAFLLLVFGIYEPTLEAVNARDMAYVATFIGGAVLGLGAFAKLLTYLLHRVYDATMAVLVGLMAGSLRALWPYLADDRSLLLPQAGDPIAVVVMLALGGAAFVLGLHAWSRSRRPLQPADASS